MALTDGLKAQIYPVAGETEIKNIVDNSSLVGMGAASLVDEGPEKAWSIVTGTLLESAVPPKTPAGGVTGSGVTIAARFKATSNGSGADFLSMFGIKPAASGVDTGVRFAREGNGKYRGRIDNQLNTALSGFALNTVYTFVYKIQLSSLSAQDYGKLWTNTVGRVGSDPNTLTIGSDYTVNRTFDRIFVNSQSGVAFALLDFAYWDRELSDAECASVADNYRAVMPDPTVVTPVSFTGTVPNQQAAVDTPFSLDLSSYFSGSLTPFAYSIFSGSLPDGLSLSGSVIGGTPTAVDTVNLVVRATDTGSNVANTNEFTIEVNLALQPPQGTVTLGPATGVTSTGASIAYSYSASDQTGFQYRLNGGSAQTASASPIVLTGLTASTAYSIEARAVNSAGSGTWSSPVNFTTAAAPQVPQGTFTIGTITTGQTTASVPYTYSASDQTSIQYRLNGGAAQTATASPQALSGLTANTAYTIEFRAVNAVGPQPSWSTAANFNTQPVPAMVGITLSDLTNNAGQPWASQTGVICDVYNQSTGALMVRKTGLSTTAGADLSFTDGALVSGTTYTVVITIGSARGVVSVVAA